MSDNNPPGDPFEFLKKMWGPMGNSLPGMVTPTLDVNEVEKRISELKSVETWLSMNLNMLKMTIQGLEMQKSTLNAFNAMGNAAKQANAASKPAPDENPGDSAPVMAPWPWNLMPQVAAQDDPVPPPDNPPAAGRAGRGKK